MSVTGVGPINGGQNQFGPLMAATPVPGVPPEVYSGDLFGPPIPQPQAAPAYPTSPAAYGQSPQTAAAAARKKQHQHHLLYAVLAGVGIAAAGLLLFATMRRGTRTVNRPHDAPPMQHAVPQTTTKSEPEKAKACDADERKRKYDVDSDDDDVDVPENHASHDDHAIDDAEVEEQEEHG